VGVRKTGVEGAGVVAGAGTLAGTGAIRGVLLAAGGLPLMCGAMNTKVGSKVRVLPGCELARGAGGAAAGDGDTAVWRTGFWIGLLDGIARVVAVVGFRCSARLLLLLMWGGGWS
jgi:hypothetical protein